MFNKIKKLIVFIIALALILGLGFALFVTYFYWRAYLTESYYWIFYVNRFNECWLEFVFFNISVIIILIAIVLLFKSYYGQEKGEQ